MQLWLWYIMYMYVKLHIKIRRWSCGIWLPMRQPSVTVRPSTMNKPHTAYSRLWLWKSKYKTTQTRKLTTWYVSLKWTFSTLNSQMILSELSKLLTLNFYNAIDNICYYYIIPLCFAMKLGTVYICSWMK